MPAPPSTVTRCPVRSRWVASPVPTTAGIPDSRATRDAWAAKVPPSVTTAATRAKRGVQAGAVAFGHQNFAFQETVEVFRSVHDADGSCHSSCAGGVAEGAMAGAECDPAEEEVFLSILGPAPR